MEDDPAVIVTTVGGTLAEVAGVVAVVDVVDVWGTCQSMKASRRAGAILTVDVVTLAVVVTTAAVVVGAADVVLSVVVTAAGVVVTTALAVAAITEMVVSNILAIPRSSELGLPPANLLKHASGDSTVDR